MAKPKVFMIIVSQLTGPLTEVQQRGIAAALGSTKMSLTAWRGGCAVATQWSGTGRELLENVKSALGTNEINLGAFQIGPDISSFGTGIFNDSAVKLKWLVE